jgi:ethanolamine utilization microcompartment shell protein EutL
MAGRPKAPLVKPEESTVIGVDAPFASAPVNVMTYVPPPPGPWTTVALLAPTVDRPVRAA